MPGPQTRPLPMSPPPIPPMRHRSTSPASQRRANLSAPVQRALAPRPCLRARYDRASRGPLSRRLRPRCRHSIRPNRHHWRRVLLSLRAQRLRRWSRRPLAPWHPRRQLHPRPPRRQREHRLLPQVRLRTARVPRLQSIRPRPAGPLNHRLRSVTQGMCRQPKQQMVRTVLMARQVATVQMADTRAIARCRRSTPVHEIRTSPHCLQELQRPWRSSRVARLCLLPSRMTSRRKRIECRS
jgi:hypothetical protein